ncbi:MAG: hypothetical protein KC731_17565 [Myxococcales bacterium]|nr:hypothetical protein [Myxococcales bacterium]
MSDSPLAMLHPARGGELPLTIHHRLVEGRAPDEDGWQLLWVEPEPEHPFATLFRSGLDYLIRVEWADFVVAPQARTIVTYTDAPSRLVEQLLVDQVFPLLLHALGRPPLHASAVAFDDEVTAFVGKSGAGKSTTSAVACQLGARLVCDDCLALTFQEDTVLAHPGYAAVRLWPDAAEALAEDPAALELVTPRTAKRRAPYPAVEHPLPLGRIVELRRGEGAPRLERLHGADALRTLGAHLHRMTDDDREALRAEFAFLAGLVERVPVLRLTTGPRLDDLPEALALLRQALRKA